MQKNTKKSLDINLNSFLHLREYPNKSLICKSKIIKFQNNSLLFEQRCILFTELCFMLIKMQAEESCIYLSQNMFINHNQLLFMFFTSDSIHKTKLKKIQHGNLLINIHQFFQLVFPCKLLQDKSFKDYQKNSIYLNTKDLIEKLIFCPDQIQSHINKKKYHHNINELDYIKFVIKQILNSHMFQEYSYFQKFSHVLLIKEFQDNQKQKEIHNQLDLQQLYFQSVYLQTKIFQIIQDFSEKKLLQDVVCQFEKNINQVFIYLQKENLIALAHSEQQPKNSHKSENKDNKPNKNNKIVSKIYISRYLRKFPYYFQTKQNSQQNNEISNNPKKQTKEQQEKHTCQYNCKCRESQRKHNQMIQRLKDTKGKIKFKFTTTFYIDKPYFIVQIEGNSQWTMDEYYFNIFRIIWNQFLSNWNNMEEQNQDSALEQRRSYKLELFQANKTLNIRQWFKVDKNMNTLNQLIAAIDQISIIFIIFQQVLSNLYKMNQNYIENDDQYLRTITQKYYVQNFVRLFKYFQQEYVQFYDQLPSKKKTHLQK